MALPLDGLHLFYLIGLVIVSPLANLLLIVTFQALTAHIGLEDSASPDQAGVNVLKGR